MTYRGFATTTASDIPDHLDGDEGLMTSWTTCTRYLTPVNCVPGSNTIHEAGGLCRGCCTLDKPIVFLGERDHVPFSTRTDDDRSSDHYKRLVRFGIADVETVIENGQSLFDEEGQRQEKRHDEHHHEPGPMILGTDWNIIKRIFVPADGEFWTAALPPSKVERSGGGGNKVISLEETRAAFQRGGFSIVINRLQRRWRSVSEISLALEDALGHPVNANLYMTPPGSQGFEAHFDWMDGAHCKNT